MVIKKIKIFLSFKFTGEDYNKLLNFIGKINQILQNNKNIETFCSLELEKWFNEKKFTHTEIYDYCLKKLRLSDILLIIINKEKESNGMLLELADAKKYNKKIILIIKENLKHNNFRSVANNIIEYKTNQELFKLLENKSIVEDYV